MARNNITTRIIDLDTPQPVDLVAEPILTFKTIEELAEPLSLIFLPVDYENQIESSILSLAEKTLLKEQIRVFFLQSEGLEYAKIFIFSDYQELKDYQISINNPEIVCLNFFSEDITSFNDNQNNFRYWMIYNDETPSEIESLKTSYLNNNGFSNIVMVQKEQNFLTALVSKYFGRIAITGFIATNPQAFALQGIDPILDETTKAIYRDNKINFYTLVNEDRKDFKQQVKDGVCLDGNAIDKVTTLNWIPAQSDNLLYNIYTQNGGNNSKIDAIEATGDRPSVYSQALVLFLDSLIQRRLILSYTITKVTVSQTVELEVNFETEITYNRSINVIKHTITNLPPSLAV